MSDYVIGAPIEGAHVPNRGTFSVYIRACTSDAHTPKLCFQLFLRVDSSAVTQKVLRMLIKGDGAPRNFHKLDNAIEWALKRGATEIEVESFTLVPATAGDTSSAPLVASA